MDIMVYTRTPREDHDGIHYVNEATKQGKEPLKQGQDKPTAKQKEKQDKAQDKSLKADKPKKSRGMKM